MKAAQKLGDQQLQVDNEKKSVNDCKEAHIMQTTQNQ